MNARAVAVWSLSAVAVTVLANNPVYRLLVTLAATTYLVAASRPGTRAWPLVSIILFAAASSVVLSLLFSHKGEDLLFRLPDQLPFIGGPLTLESLAFGAGSALGLAAVFTAAAPFRLVLDPDQVVEALPSLLQRTGTVIGASMDLVPAVARNFRAVSEAQAMRGLKLRGLSGLEGVVVPVTLSSLESSIQLAEAMEARAFGSGSRTHFRVSTWSLRDATVVLAALLAVAMVVAARVLGIDPDWSPYPAFSLPQVHPFLVTACALLTVPGLR